MRYVMTDTIVRVEERASKRWVSGTGKDAKFVDESEGWYAVFASCPASMFLGSEEPTLRAGDKIRITMEKVQ